MNKVKIEIIEHPPIVILNQLGKILDSDTKIKLQIMGTPKNTILQSTKKLQTKYKLQEGQPLDHDPVHPMVWIPCMQVDKLDHNFNCSTSV